MPAGGEKPLRKFKTCRRHNEPGQAHALTFSCFRQQSFLSRDRTRIWFIDSLAVAKNEHKFDIWAYVLMPEHVHLLIYPLEKSYSISEILKDIKQPVTRKAVRFVRQQSPKFLARMADAQSNGTTKYRFWQRGGGYDRNLVSPAIIHSTIDYIHDNPVRRGLVERAEDWYWSSVRFFHDGSEVPLVPDVESIPSLPKH